MLTRFLAMTAAAACMTLSSVSSALAQPDVFSDAGFDADRAAAIEQDKLHLVYATATWCPPCQQMKKTTWVDDSVVSWLEDHAVVTPLDVDRFRSKSSSLRVRAMPTMILFEGDRELARAVGYQSAERLTAWLESNAPAGAGAAGETADADGEEAAAAPLDPSLPLGPQLAARAESLGTPMDLELELEAVRARCAAGEHALAAEAYAWLFENERRLVRRKDDARIELIGPAMRELSAQHTPSAERFAAQRDAITRALGSVDARTLQKWALLHCATGTEDAMADELAALLAKRAPTPALRSAAGSFVSVLGERGRYDVLAQLISPTRYADRLAHGVSRNTSRSKADDDVLRTRLAAAYGTALYIGDPAGARAVAKTARALDPTPAMRTALAEAADAADAEPVGLDGFEAE